MYSICIALASGAAFLIAWIFARGWLWGAPPPGTRLPPTPPGASLLGHQQIYQRDFFCNTAIKWAKEYGPVYRIRVNAASIVILNDFESIKKFYARKEFLERSRFWILSRTKYNGLATQNGEIWDAHRRFCLPALRDLGMGKSAAVRDIVEEFQSAAENIQKAEGQAVDFYKLILPCASNNISTLLYGRRFPYDHPTRAYVDQLVRRLVKALRLGALFQFKPTLLTTIMINIPGSRLKKVISSVDDISLFTKKEIEEHAATAETGFDRDFIDAYLEKVRGSEGCPSPHFSLDTLVGTVTGFFVAGSVSTAGTIHWHMVKFAQEPDTIQAKVQQEIDQVIGRERKPTWEDRLRMPFTMACVWEMDRWKTAAPLGPARDASEPAVVDEFYIPKGTVILANFWAAHFDPKVWNNPLEFDPSRFLNKDGSLVARKPDCLMAFSTGKRTCPGEILATMEIFLAITTFLQRFHVLPAGKAPFDINDPKILAGHIEHLKLRFLPRSLAD
ncbi:cytochrome P450 2F3-like isoform X1 [Haemaphysalis longicornis]